MKFCDKNGQNYHKMTISCVYELGGYLDNVLSELVESGFCIATYLNFHIKDVIENVINVIDINNNV